MEHACAADGDGAREEGHAEGFVVCYALESADEIGSFEVLVVLLVCGCGGRKSETYL